MTVDCYRVPESISRIQREMMRPDMPRYILEDLYDFLKGKAVLIKEDDGSVKIRPDYLDCCTASIPQPHKSCVKEKENNMYNNKSVNVDLNIETTTASSQDAVKARYLENELYSVFFAKEKDARKVFYMDADQAPTTPKEYVERIKAGTFTFKDRFANADGEWLGGYEGCYNAEYAIEWRTVPADKVGYKAALSKVEVARKDAERTIKIGTPAEGLAALKAFESMTIN